MKLISLPDYKKVHTILTIGKEYEFLNVIGNGVTIMADDGETKLIILRERFE